MSVGNILKAPLIVGVRQFSNWMEAGSLEAALDGLGRNTGNMMFTQALLSAVSGARWGSFALSPSDLEGRDSIVVACANWINGFEDFGWLADRLERTELPVILVGIGAQSTLAHEAPPLMDGTRRLLSIATERSSFISARGEFSADVLSSHGFKNSLPTGCPSLLAAGRGGILLRKPQELTIDRTCIHATRHGFQMSSELDGRLYSIAYRSQADIILQSEALDMVLTLSGESATNFVNAVGPTLEAAYGANLPKVADYLRRHGRFFTNVHDWISYSKRKEYCVGTRIHGTVAALLAGTPATLIVHDSRTKEMARAMSIPAVATDALNSDVEADLTRLYEPEAMDRFVSTYSTYYLNFEYFFRCNGLSLMS